MGGNGIDVESLIAFESWKSQPHKDSELEELLPERGQILSGWKEIARCLGKGVRTVQRYEKDCALPIHRPAGKSRGAVMATTAEIHAWMRARRLPRDNVGSHYNSLRDNIVQFQRNCMRMVELHTRLCESITMLQSNIQNVSLARSSSRVTPNVDADSSSNA